MSDNVPFMQQPLDQLREDQCRATGSIAITKDALRRMLEASEGTQSDVVQVDLARGDLRRLDLAFWTNQDPATRKHLGTLRVGAHPRVNGEGIANDTFVFDGSGGVVVLPFTHHPKLGLLVGVLDELRPLEWHPVHHPDGVLTNAPRGNFDTVEQQIAAAAKNELESEVGEFLAGKPFLLPGEATNGDTAWLRYFPRADGSIGGVYHAALEVPFALLDETGDGQMSFRPGVLQAKKQGSPGEKILRTKFIPWAMAAELRDGLTAPAVLRLLAYLDSLPPSEDPPVSEV